jgi:hypothetical protein
MKVQLLLRRPYRAVRDRMGRHVIEIDLTRLADRWEQIAEEGIDRDEVLKAEIESISSGAAREAVAALVSGARSIVRSDRRFGRRFESRLERVWRPPLDLFEVVRTLSLEFGMDLNARLRPAASAKQDFVFEALTRLHGRACLTASEVSALLRTGHATGANARWRTLHELAVVAMFIAQHGQDVARRYLEHQAVEAFRAARRYQEFCRFLGEVPLEDEEIDELERSRDELVGKYGSEYAEQYGWAAQVLGVGKPTFAQIAGSVHMDHWSPYVRMAGHGVHAGPRGAFFDLGLPSGMQAIPAGPSHFGLADPGGNSLISLLQVSTALLAHGLEVDDSDATSIAEGIMVIVEMRILQTLVDKAIEAFNEIHRLQEEWPPRLGKAPRIWVRPKFG